MYSTLKSISVIIALLMISLQSNIVRAEDNPKQIVELQTTAPGNIVRSGEIFTVSAVYDVSNGEKLTGIGFQIFYNSSFFEKMSIDYFYEDSPTGLKEFPDVNNLDNDPATDNYLVMGWSVYGGNSWPYLEPPIELIRIVFKLKNNIQHNLSTINLIKKSNASTHDFEGKNLQIEINPPSNPDINQDGELNLIDVIQILKHVGSN